MNPEASTQAGSLREREMATEDPESPASSGAKPMSWGGSGTPGLFTEGSSAMLRAALNYAARGWRVFPVWGVRDAGACRCGDPACPRAGKHPIGAAAPRGLHDASSDALLVREWWAAHPEANIGIATGLAAGLVVVDVDPGGEESLAALEAEYGRLPPTLEAATGRGRHLYFVAPGCRLRSRVGVRPGLDVRGEGGYVVAPPSRHASLASYEWACADIEPAEMPKRMVAMLSARVSTSTKDGAAGPTSWDEATAARVRDALQFVPASEYAPWIQVGQALHHASVGHALGLDIWTRWSATCPEKFQPDECAARWVGFGGHTGDPVTLGTLFHLAKLGGWVPPGRGAVPAPPAEPLRGAPDGGFDRGDDEELARHILRNLTQRATAAPVYDRDRLWVYGPDRGVWAVIDSLAIENMVGAFAGAPVRTMRNGQEGTRDLHISNTRRMGTRRTICSLASGPGFLDDPPAGLAFANGLVALDAEGRIELRSHSPQNKCTEAFGFDYGPAHGPTWLRTLGEWLGDDEDGLAKQQLLQEFVGAALFGIAPQYQRALILLGEGSNGKSTCLAVLAALFPSSAITATPPQDYECQYRRAKLVGVRVNIANEMPTSEVMASASLKAIISGEEVEGRPPYGEPFRFRPKAAHIFAANRLPATRDTTPAFWRRWVILDFGRAFVDGKKDPNLAHRIVAEELPGVIAWAFEGASRLVRRGRYALPRSHHTHLDAWRGHADPVAAWMDRCCERTGSTAQSLLYSNYAAWAQAKDQTPVPPNVFGRRLGEAGVPMKKSGSVKSRGLTLRVGEAE